MYCDKEINFSIGLLGYGNTPVHSIRQPHGNTNRPIAFTAGWCT
jgi:hypothetical protein